MAFEAIQAGRSLLMSAQGGLFGGFIGAVLSKDFPAIPLSGGPLIQGRKDIRSDDICSSMVAAFGTGAMYSLVSGMAGPNYAESVIRDGLIFSVIQFGVFQIEHKIIRPLHEARTTNMLSLQQSEKNRKCGLLTKNPFLVTKNHQISLGPSLAFLDRTEWSLKMGVQALCLVVLIKHVFRNPFK